MLSNFGIGFAELMIAAGVLAMLAAPAILYILTLRRAVARCSPASRTMVPDEVWLLLIPVWNVFWHFYLVGRVASSLGNELRSRSVGNQDHRPGRSVGLAMLLVPLGGLLPAVGKTGTTAFLLAGFVCWIWYWVKIAAYSRSLGTVYNAEPLHKYLWIGIGGLVACILLPTIGTTAWLSVNEGGPSAGSPRTVAEALRGFDSGVRKSMVISGSVQDGSIQRAGGTISFVMVDDNLKLPVIYDGFDPLPDNFKDGAQIVASGSLNRQRIFLASKVRLRSKDR